MVFVHTGQKPQGNNDYLTGIIQDKSIETNMEVLVKRTIDQRCLFFFQVKVNKAEHSDT